MAAVTLLGAVTFDTNTGTKTVTATPAVGDLIVIVTAHSENTSAATPTDDQGGTYTTIQSSLAAGVDTMMLHIRTATIPSAVSTIFSHAPGTTTGGGLAVLKVTGMSRVGASAALQSAKQDNQAATTTPAPVLGAIPQSGNPVIGAVFVDNENPASLTPRASPAYTELADVGYATPKAGLEIMSINSGETSATITWGSVSAGAFGDIVVELDASAAAVSLTPGVGSLTAAGIAAVIVKGTLITPLVGALAATALASSLVSGTFLKPTVGALTLSGAAPTAIVATFRTPTVGALTLSGVAPSATQGSPITPSVGTLSFAEQTSAVVQGTPLIPAVGTLTLLGVAPTTLANTFLSPAVGTLTLTGQTPTRLIGTPMTPAAGTLALAPTSPSLLLNTFLQPPAGALLFTGVAPTLGLSIPLTPGTGTLTLTGTIPALGPLWPYVVFLPDERRYTFTAGERTYVFLPGVRTYVFTPKDRSSEGGA